MRKHKNRCQKLINAQCADEALLRARTAQGSTNPSKGAALVMTAGMERSMLSVVQPSIAGAQTSNDSIQSVHR